MFLKPLSKLSWIYFFTLSKFQPIFLCNYSWLRLVLTSWVSRISIDRYFVNCFIEKKYLRRILFFFNKHTCTQLHVLTDIACVDFPEKDQRFLLIYNLLSVHFSIRFKVFCSTSALDPVDSVEFIFGGAGWLEREVWDLFGVFFFQHQDLRRILTDYGFEGHPLRKDFPLTGFLEVSYSDIEKKIIYEPVSFAQEFRNFEFLNPWSLSEY